MVRRRQWGPGPLTISQAVLFPVALTVAAACLVSGCFGSRYVLQAGMGQLELFGDARPIPRVLRDPDTDDRTRVLLAEVQQVKRYALRHGLETKGNYDTFVQLDREAVVWFLTASHELAFEPKIWNFPIVGSFPYLGWFSLEEALRYRTELEREGWDVYMRPVQAYSTGGWFNYAVLSSMLSPGDDAFRYLINVILHELVHANILINDQSTFNESLASFTADGMTADYLARRFGADSEELSLYRLGLDEGARQGALRVAAYEELDRLYKSDASELEKRAGKARIMARLQEELGLTRLPNNAALIGFRTYNAGFDEFTDLRRACGSWASFLAAIRNLDESAFTEAQMDDIGPVIRKLADHQCPAATARP